MMNPVDQKLSSLTWQGNSQKMYQAILKEIPFFLHDNIKNKVAAFLDAKHTKVVTEELVFEAVRNIAPPDIASRILRELTKMKS